MTSREIVIGLIDKGAIDGKQAATLLNDIYQSELLESWKALNNKENHDLAKDMLKDNGGYWASPSTWTIGTTSTNIPLGSTYAVTADALDTISTATATISSK